MSAFRILLADEHPVFRLGLCSLLGSHEGWTVCGEAGDGCDAVEKCRQLKPDLLLLDIWMPKLNGVEAARRILSDNPGQRILVVTDVESEQVIRDCLKAGVHGWVFKTDTAADLITAVGELQRDRSSFSARVSALILDGYHRNRITTLAPEVPRLSIREREVVRLVGAGKASKEVAVMLGLSLKTIETHRSNIMRKLQIHSVAELVLYAVRNEIVHVQHPVSVFPIPGNGRADAASPGSN